MSLHDKRFGSKASSASRLSPNNFAFSKMQRFIFLRWDHSDTVSNRGKCGRGSLLSVWTGDCG